MRAIQFVDPAGVRFVGVIEEGEAHPRIVRGASSLRDLAIEAGQVGTSLAECIARHGAGERVDYDALVAERRLLPPLDHPDPSHCIVSVTGLTHLGSAKSREAMHAKLASADLSDSMRMFKLGLEGGRPVRGAIGVQPEWAYKGDGSWVVAPEQPLRRPAYAEDGGDEAEVVGLYVIGDDGQVLRVGFCIGNEYSDHIMEQRNYLYLAHSKLRQCSYGPEVLVGKLPADVSGQVRVVRSGSVAWEGNFISGETNMTHTIANLEHHHFKYENFRRPGDVHVHFFGASTLSFAESFKVAQGDVLEVECPAFGRALRNPIIHETDDRLIEVRAL